jgi:hypothetical protein
MSFLTGTNVETIYTNTNVGATLATFTTEAPLNAIASIGPQPVLPPWFWSGSPTSEGRGFHVTARGIMSTFTSGTFTISVRLGAIASITAPIVLGSAAMVMTVSQTNVVWELEGDVIMTNVGVATAAATVRGIGTIKSGALASPFIQPVFGGAASPGTVATIDLLANNYLNFNAACSVSNAANSITLQQLLVFGLN